MTNIKNISDSLVIIDKCKSEFIKNKEKFSTERRIDWSIARQEIRNNALEIADNLVKAHRALKEISKCGSYNAAVVISTHCINKIEGRCHGK